MTKNKLLRQLYETHDNYLAKQSDPPEKVPVEELIGSFFCPGPFYYYVIDSPTITYERTSRSMKDILGKDFTGHTLEELLTIVHPDDVDFLFTCENFVAHFLQNRISPDNIVNYKITYCLRERVKDGTYKLFLMQTITLSTTPEGALLKVMGVHTDISHITTVNNHRLSLIGLNGEPSYLSMDVKQMVEASFHESAPLFSKRELEIVRLLGEGLTAKEIAGKLFLAESTVSTHKRNILNKAKCKNTAQLVAYCIRMGWI